MKRKQLTEAEEAIMSKIWEIEAPITSSILLNEFSETRGWKSQTINTFLSRLVEKEYLSVKKKGNINEYHATISKQEFDQNSVKDMIDKVYGGSIQKMIASFVESDSISKKELDEIKKWFSENKED